MKYHMENDAITLLKIEKSTNVLYNKGMNKKKEILKNIEKARKTLNAGKPQGNLYMVQFPDGQIGCFTEEEKQAMCKKHSDMFMKKQ